MAFYSPLDELKKHMRNTHAQMTGKLKDLKVPEDYIYNWDWPPRETPNETPIQKDVRLFLEAQTSFYAKQQRERNMHDNVNHPKHYNSHPSGIECITITEHMSFNLGNAIKYLWRADAKGQAMDDLRKAKWYIEREIQKRLNDVAKQEVQE